MRSEPAQADLDRAAGFALSGGACLMCYERDHRRCHRDIVSGLLAERTGVTLRHLTVRAGLSTQPAGFDF
jgi:uncharacterized protein (DUF488 family)